MGILSINASGVIQEGDLSSGKDLSGWAVLVRTSASLGKLKLSGNLTMLSGNDGSDAMEDGRFRTPQEGGSGWFFGSHIMSSRRWTALGNDIRSVHLGALNGATVLEGLADYKVSKTLTLGGGVSLYQCCRECFSRGKHEHFQGIRHRTQRRLQVEDPLEPRASRSGRLLLCAAITVE